MNIGLALLLTSIAVWVFAHILRGTYGLLVPTTLVQTDEILRDVINLICSTAMFVGSIIWIWTSV